jgi:uncharacterized protein (DUF1697 family)
MAEMTRYIALLRGINVGGHNVRMEDLRRLFEELGLQEVRTYIQSGNVFFSTGDANTAGLTRKIKRQLREVLGFETAVFLRTIPQLEVILADAPFKKLKVTPNMRLCVVLADEPIHGDLELPLFSPKKDMQIVKTTRCEAYGSGISRMAGRQAPRVSSMPPSARRRRPAIPTSYPGIPPSA